MTGVEEPIVACGAGTVEVLLEVSVWKLDGIAGDFVGELEVAVGVTVPVTVDDGVMGIRMPLVIKPIVETWPNVRIPDDCPLQQESDPQQKVPLDVEHSSNCESTRSLQKYGHAADFP